MKKEGTLEGIIHLVYSTLPRTIYMDFERWFMSRPKEDDDISLQLFVEITALNKVRVFYHGDDGLDQTLHGGALSIGQFTEKNLKDWFIEMTNIREWSVEGGPIVLNGANEALKLIFSTLPAKTEHGELSVLIGEGGSSGPYDIYYRNGMGDNKYVDGESTIAMEHLTADILLENYRSSLRK